MSIMQQFKKEVKQAQKNADWHAEMGGSRESGKMYAEDYEDALNGALLAMSETVLADIRKTNDPDEIKKLIAKMF